MKKLLIFLIKARFIIRHGLGIDGTCPCGKIHEPSCSARIAQRISRTKKFSLGGLCRLILDEVDRCVMLSGDTFCGKEVPAPKIMARLAKQI